MNEAELLGILDELRALPREIGAVEFKGNVQDPKEIGEYLSALANSAALNGHERAWMVWGVANDTHDVVGTGFDPFTKKGDGNQDLIMWLQQMTTPRADFTFHECRHSSGKVVLLEIHPARTAPIAFNNVRYIRIDSHKTKLSDHSDKEARLWAKLGQKDDWSGEVVADATIGDLDEEAVQEARKRFIEYQIKSEADATRHGRIRNDTAAWDVPTLLNKARLAKAGRLTRAAILLLGKDESAHFISPVDSKMSWILHNEGGKIVDSQHFGCPFLLSTDRLYKRIRNLVVERMPDGTLFPEALQQYDAWVIREALHNAIAHQDYRLGGKINVSEFPDRIVLSNLGQFIPPSIEWMLEHQSPPEHYRNQWLIEAMIRLRMMDQIGSGIRRMFTTQRERNFPLPDYTIERSGSQLPRVEVSIPGRILDARYTRLLMLRSDIPLSDIVLLDMVQKHARLSRIDVPRLRKAGLVEGRYPNLFVSGKVAAVTDQKAQHIRQRGFDTRYYLDMVRDLIHEHGPVDRTEINRLLLGKLPEVLSESQKDTRVHNLITALSRAGEIQNQGSRRYPKWVIANGSHNEKAKPEDQKTENT